MSLNSSSECERFEVLLGSPPTKEQEAALAAHLDVCPACQARLDRPPTPSSLPDPGPPPDATVVPMMDQAMTANFDDDKIKWELDFLIPPIDSSYKGRIGNYKVIREIGRGGMGIVLEAIDETLRGSVALKFLARDLASKTDARTRFIREAWALAQISSDRVIKVNAVKVVHENQVRDIEQGEQGKGRPFLVMEYIQGESLQEKIDGANGPLHINEILSIGEQVAAGLWAVHNVSIVHRDVAPKNILLYNGVPSGVKIADFGLARAPGDIKVTQAGTFTGTPQYASPEQARGEEVTRAGDLFSLGSVLYAMCTGVAPFDATTPLDILKRVCDNTPRPIRKLNPDIPEWLVVCVEKLHAKNPADRYQSADEVAKLLRSHMGGARPPAVPSTPKRRLVNKNVGAMVGVVVLLAVGILVGGYGYLSPSTASKSEAMTTLAWEQYQKGRDIIDRTSEPTEHANAIPFFEEAVRSATINIDDNGAQAADMQKRLAASNVTLPEEGRVPRRYFKGH